MGALDAGGDPPELWWRWPVAVTLVCLPGIVVSVPLFSNQVLFVGLVPRLVPGVGDVTILVGIALSAAVYALLFRRQGDRAE